MTRAPWPAVDERYLVRDTIELVVQVNGKVRARVEVPADASKEAVEAAARPAIARWLEGKEVAKTIVVPGRLVSFVVR